MNLFAQGCIFYGVLTKDNYNPPWSDYGDCIDDWLNDNPEIISGTDFSQRVPPVVVFAAGDVETPWAWGIGLPSTFHLITADDELIFSLSDLIRVDPLELNDLMEFISHFDIPTQGEPEYLALLSQNHNSQYSN